MEKVFRSFQEDVVDASSTTPIVVDFWAEWCGPCRVLGPVLERLEQQAAGGWRLVKVNVDEHPEVAQTYRIQGIPAVKLFYEGKEIAEFTGALPEHAVVRWLDTHVPSESGKAVGEAEEAIIENFKMQIENRSHCFRPGLSGVSQKGG